MSVQEIKPIEQIIKKMGLEPAEPASDITRNGRLNVLMWALTKAHPSALGWVYALLGFGIDLVTVFAKSGIALQPMAFPKHAMAGSLGELAIELSKGTEVPEEFIFATALTCFGAIATGQLKLNIGLDSDTRLFTVLLGKSASAKKSSAMARTIEFFEKINSPIPWARSYGVGSAEGLAKELSQEPRRLLALDELRAFMDKSTVQASVLLPMVASLFEKHSWDNATKTGSISIRNARLSLVGCCTTETYEHLWTTEAIAIGMPNRLFVVDADAKPKVAWPQPPDAAVLDALRQRIQQQLARLPVTLEITPEAKLMWEGWYQRIPASEHAKRLDTIGFRLMPTLALTMDRQVVDSDVVERVIAVLDYELWIRTLTDPIDADDRIAKLETKIRRYLKADGPLTRRELRQKTHADRDGLWAFEQALKNLVANEDIMLRGDEYYLTPEAKEAA